MLEGDLTNPFVSGDRAPGVDVVFHLAANIDTAATGAELDVNDIGTEHLLAWLGNSCRGARIVYTSSIAVHDRRGASKRRPLNESSPDHSTLSLTRRRLPPEVFTEVFQFVLQIAAEKKLLSGKTVGVDSTTLEADAAMKSIIRRDTGEGWKTYVTPPAGVGVV